MGREDLLRSLSRRICDERVLAAIAAVPRELFVSRALAAAAYEDAALRIGGGQTISQPTVVARMCELLELSPTDRVLDVGTGSGYHAAVLSRLCDFVWGVELDPQLALRAARTLTRAGIHNVTVCSGDGAQGLPEHAPFDAINVAATARDRVPPVLAEQLGDGGRLVVPVARGRDEHLVRVRRQADGFAYEALEPVRFVPLR
ncbi:MAG: protein-L-isoaspartate(D-aspartate) O-methyltransferase [Solirubrobacteraceae bacterium]|jgi:protein-L-isoaspartate(D-aspartate) O-methyltransferase|nr:protein-L-isoaspartate(D-aspartate) O-methyltransferase [Solirubrobacteraceae bacterium]